MAKMLGYMITWTTYGTWLPGDDRGYVTHGKILGRNEGLRQTNMRRLKSRIVNLSQQEQEVVRRAILSRAESLRQKIYAIVVRSNHVHIVAQRISKSIEMVVSYYKNSARLALRANGFTDRLWTRGFDKRFCYEHSQLKGRIEYLQGHPE
ncbi:MAG: hypothetical protein GWP14_05110 [Actinobacteria bacterium]|nr:hypothetical protein [Actinomycetota bacterium]